MNLINDGDLATKGFFWLLSISKI